MATDEGINNSWEKFVEIWETSDSVQEAAKRMGYSRGHAERTATKLRQAGVQLKSMRANKPIRGDIDVSSLNKFIANIRGDENAETEELENAVADGIAVLNSK